LSQWKQWSLAGVKNTRLSSIRLSGVAVSIAAYAPDTTQQVLQDALAVVVLISSINILHVASLHVVLRRIVLRFALSAAISPVPGLMAGMLVILL